jgi:hypothetical protein
MHYYLSMKDLQNILIESLLDDEDTLTKPIEDFYLKPFQSIFTCGPKIKSQRDWENYVSLFESSIKAGCDYSFEHGGDYVYTAKRRETQWVLSIKNDGYDNRKIIVLHKYNGPYITFKAAIVSFRNFPEKIRLRVGDNAMKQLNIKGQKGMSYVLSKKQIKMVDDMLNSWASGDLQDWLKK